MTPTRIGQAACEAYLEALTRLACLLNAACWFDVTQAFDSAETERRAAVGDARVEVDDRWVELGQGGAG